MLKMSHPGSRTEAHICNPKLLHVQPLQLLRWQFAVSGSCEQRVETVSQSVTPTPVGPAAERNHYITTMGTCNAEIHQISLNTGL